MHNTIFNIHIENIYGSWLVCRFAHECWVTSCLCKFAWLLSCVLLSRTLRALCAAAIVTFVCNVLDRGGFWVSQIPVGLWDWRVVNWRTLEATDACGFVRNLILTFCSWHCATHWSHFVSCGRDSWQDSNLRLPACKSSVLTTSPLVGCANTALEVRVATLSVLILVQLCAIHRWLN